MVDSDFNNEIAQFIKLMSTLMEASPDSDELIRDRSDELGRLAIEIKSKSCGMFSRPVNLTEQIKSVLLTDEYRESRVKNLRPDFILTMIDCIAESHSNPQDSYWWVDTYVRDTLSGEINLDSLLRKYEAITDIPGFDPDGWFDRRLKLEPVFVNKPEDLPEFLTERFEEATRCYIYGNYLGGTALCRATLEAALKWKYGEFFESSQRSAERKKGFKENVRGLWSKVKELRDRQDILELVERIIDDGNQVLHRRTTNRVIHLFNEYTLHKCLTNLKNILEFLFLGKPGKVERKPL